MAAPLSSSELATLATSLMLGTWRSNKMVSEREVKALTLHFPKRKRGAQAVIDGELVELEARVALTIRPGGLRVIHPQQTSEAP